MSYSTYGTNTSLAEPPRLVPIASVAFEHDTLILSLSDGRAIHLDMSRYAWLNWLLKASLEQRKQWEIMPSGGGVWWDELDEGIELQPLLDLQPLR
jgi:hypothetical protein